MTTSSTWVSSRHPEKSAFSRPVRLTIVMSHPIQYQAPLFRHLSANCPDLEITVIYVTLPTPAQQGSGFGVAFAWDVPLLSGYDWRVSRGSRTSDRYDHFLGIDERGLPDLLLETNPDIAVVPGWQFAGLLRAVLTLRRAGIPVLYRGDTNLAQGPPNGWHRWLWEERTRRLLGLFDGFLAVGTRSREYLAHFGVASNSVFSSPHCVDNEYFTRDAARFATPAARSELRRTLGLPVQGLVILFVGKLEPRKRPLDLIHAAARVGGTPTVLVIGAGPLEAACRAEARRLGVATVWAGFLNQSQVSRAYFAADVLALPSGFETWGLVVNEAMACGVPCIVSDRVGCAPDLVVPGITGEVFPAGNVQAFVRAIDHIAELLAEGQDFAGPCRDRARSHSLRTAADGILAAATSILEPRPLSHPNEPIRARVVAALDDSPSLDAVEHTLNVLKTIQEHGAMVHRLVNDMHSAGPEAASTVSETARNAGATSSEVPSAGPARGQNFGDLGRFLRATAGMARTNANLLHKLLAARATHVLLPTPLGAIRRAPALLLARALGLRTVLTLGDSVTTEEFHAAAGSFVDSIVDVYACGSSSSLEAVLSSHVSARKALVIRSCSPTEPFCPPSFDPSPSSNSDSRSIPGALSEARSQADEDSVFPEDRADAIAARVDAASDDGLGASLTGARGTSQRIEQPAPASVDSRESRRHSAASWAQVLAPSRRASAVMRLMPGWMLPGLALLPTLVKLRARPLPK